MNIYCEHLKREFFDKYKKYWYCFGAFVLICVTYFFFSYSLNVNNITLNIENAIYIGNAVAINPKQLIANKKLIEDSCWTRNHFAQGNFYAITDYNIFQLALEESDEATNMLLLRVKGDENHLRDFAVLDMEEPGYQVDGRLLIPVQKNRVSTFNYEKAKIISVDRMDFYIVSRDILKSDYAIGVPLFNKNFLLHGIVKSSEDSQRIDDRMERMLVKANIQKYFSVNKVASIRRFLDKNNTEYYVADNSENMLNDERYNIKKSVYNIICVLNKNFR